MSLLILKNKLKNILGDGDQNGVVVERTNDFLKVATKSGAIFFADQSGFEAGDNVVIKNNQLFRIDKTNIPVYYI